MNGEIDVPQEHVPRSVRTRRFAEDIIDVGLATKNDQIIQLAITHGLLFQRKDPACDNGQNCDCIFVCNHVPVYERVFATMPSNQKLSLMPKPSACGCVDRCTCHDFTNKSHGDFKWGTSWDINWKGVAIFGCFMGVVALISYILNPGGF